jgi:tetratricopeptide (TPR) repeat protein
MCPVLERFRSKAEAETAEGDWRLASYSWSMLWTLAGEFSWGDGSPQTWGALSRAARCILEADGTPLQAMSLARMSLFGFAESGWFTGTGPEEMAAFSRHVLDEVQFARDTFDSARDKSGGNEPGGLGDDEDAGAEPPEVKDLVASIVALASYRPSRDSENDARANDEADRTLFAAEAAPEGSGGGRRPDGAEGGKVGASDGRPSALATGHPDAVMVIDALAGHPAGGAPLGPRPHRYTGLRATEGSGASVAVPVSAEGAAIVPVSPESSAAVPFSHEAPSASGEPGAPSEEIARLRVGAGEGSPEELAIMARLGAALAQTGRDGDEAAALLGRSARKLSEALGPDHPSAVDAWTRWADFLCGSLCPGAGLERLLPPLDPPREVDLREALSFCIRRAMAAGETGKPALEARLRLAAVLFASGRLEDALELRLAALTAARRDPGPDSPLALSAGFAAAESLAAAGDLAAARKVYKEISLVYALTLGSEHPVTAGATSFMGAAEEASGDPEMALCLYAASSRALAALGGAHKADVLTLRMRMAGILAELGDPGMAALHYSMAASGWAAFRGEGNPRQLASVELEARARLAAGNAGYAAGILGPVAEARERALAAPEPPSPGGHPGHGRPDGRAELASTLALLAEAVLADGEDPGEAQAALARELELREALTGPDSPEALDAVFRLARAVEACGDVAEALALHLRALEGRKSVLGLRHPDTERSAAAVSGLRTPSARRRAARDRQRPRTGQ